MTKSVLISTMALMILTTCLMAQDVSWRQMDGPIGANVTKFAFDADGAIIAALATDLFGTLYAATSEGVYRSEDRAVSWTAMNTGLEHVNAASPILTE